jgi:hypothetical protein
VGRKAGVNGRGKSRPHRDSIPGPSSPTALSRPTHLRIRGVLPKHSTSAAVPVAAAPDHEVVMAGNVKLHHFGNIRKKKSVQLQAAAALHLEMTFQTETAYTFSALHDGSCSYDGRFCGM